MKGSGSPCNFYFSSDMISTLLNWIGGVRICSLSLCEKWSAGYEDKQSFDLNILVGTDSIYWLNEFVPFLCQGSRLLDKGKQLSNLNFGSKYLSQLLYWVICTDHLTTYAPNAVMHFGICYLRLWITNNVKMYRKSNLNVE